MLSEEYDSQMTKWEKSVERIENNPKKKLAFHRESIPVLLILFLRLRDQKNREMFERCFPELKAKHEHQDRMTRYGVLASLATSRELCVCRCPLRVDQRGYGIVRSDAELKEIMYELCEQEEAPVRYRRTHAVIPPMLIEEREKRVKFFNSNGLISDPMALHRDSRFIGGAWSEEEKTIFRDKSVLLGYVYVQDVIIVVLCRYTFYPKNFGVIASFLPNKVSCLYSPSIFCL